MTISVSSVPGAYRLPCEKQSPEQRWSLAEGLACGRLTSARTASQDNSQRSIRFQRTARASETCLPPGHLLGDLGRGGAAEASAGADRILDPEHLMDRWRDPRL